ncbi:MAG: integrase [Elusimicrobiota bacterium]
MEIKFKMAYFRGIYDRYHSVSSPVKTEILDEFCNVCGYNRKYAIRKLNKPPSGQRAAVVNNRRHSTKYEETVVDIITKVWEAAGYPCSDRLKSVLPLWMPWIEKYFTLNCELKEKILKISPSQMDRRMRTQKLVKKRRIYGRTKPGTLLKHHIPIKTDHWDVKEPGYTEVDTVSHSGNSADGTFAYSVNQTDILTTWVETRAVLGKGERNISSALDEMEETFPFKVLGLDSDNGSEFINYHLYERCKNRNIQFTRGRQYKKNDNAHIEQKNWTHVRKIMGWDRYDTHTAVDAMNNLYKNELRLFMNLFMPSMKLLDKKRIGSKVKRHYDKPATPLDRLIASGKGYPDKIEQLIKLRETMDPFELSRIIDKKLGNIIKLTNYRQSPKTSQKSGLPALSGRSMVKSNRKLSRREQAVLEEVSELFGMNILVNK